jgi:hypothetical protein
VANVFTWASGSVLGQNMNESKPSFDSPAGKGVDPERDVAHEASTAARRADRAYHILNSTHRRRVTAGGARGVVDALLPEGGKQAFVGNYQDGPEEKQSEEPLVEGVQEPKWKFVLIHRERQVGPDHG